MKEILERLKAVEEAIGYQTRLLEELTSLISKRSEDNQQAKKAVQAQLTAFSRLVAGHQAFKSNTEMVDLLNKLSVFGDKQ